MGKNTRHAAIAVVVTMATAALLAQDARPRPAFEVTSVKRNATVDAGGGGGFLPGGRFRLSNIDLQTLIRIAYREGVQLLPSQIVGGPEWTRSEYWDVNAKVGDDLAGKPTAELIRLQPFLLRSLLADRFQLKVHRETRQLERYALVRARKDGALGPNLQAASVDCRADLTRCNIRTGPGAFASGSTLLSALANYLGSVSVSRVVVDRTGLEGRFEINLEWSPDQTATDKPSIFAALQEQLGLKLEAERGPVDVVVIDHVERPTED